MTALGFSNPQVILFSSNVEHTVAFYTRLGFHEVFRVPAEGRPIHADLELDGYRIGFADIESARSDHGIEPAETGGRGTITLWTDDTRAAYEALLAEGVPSLGGPNQWLGRLLIAWVSDPDGHPIQIVQDTSGGR